MNGNREFNLIATNTSYDCLDFLSEDIARALRNALDTVDFRIFFVIDRPEFLRSLLFHFDLYIVFTDVILAKDKLRGIFDKQTCV